MKTFLKATIVLVVLNLATGCFASAKSGYGGEEKEAAKKDIEKEMAERAAERLEEMEKRAQEYAKEMAERSAERQVGRPTPQPRVRGRSTGRPHLFAGEHSGSGRIFVIPTSEMKAEDYVTIVEDMRVMSRIFDKKLDLSPGGMFLDSGFNFSFLGLPGASTEAIFLQGYGVLFLMNVDFPLSPPAEEQEQAEEEPKEHIDELWKETRQEIYEPADARRKRTDEEEMEEYDKEEVEEMKETLIKALKHATNIRNLKADESVILTVTGSGDTDRTTIALGSGTNQILIKDNGTIKVGVHAGPSLKGMGFSPTVMTIRVKKSDVDAFANGRLDFDKFRQKVQIFTY